MISKVFLFGIIGSIAVAVAVASIFSMGAATAQMTSMSNQQMMQHQQMQQGQHQEMKHGMFSASGMSMVQNVRITGVSITDDNEVVVNLMYSGNSTSPDVTVVAMTNHNGMMEMMSSGGMSGRMSSGTMDMNSMGTMGTNVTNSTQHSMMMRMQSGSATVDAGWETGDEVQVTLDGNASAYDAADVHVIAFPHIT